MSKKKEDIITDCGGIPFDIPSKPRKQKQSQMYVEPASYFPKDIDENYFGRNKKVEEPAINEGRKIFGYRLEDAWGRDLSMIEVYDRPKDSVVYFPVDKKGDNNWIHPDGYKRADLDEAVIELIKTKIEDDEIYEIDELEDSSVLGFLVLDGVNNKFYFSNKGRVKELTGKNISSCIKDLDKCPNLRKIINVCERVRRILYKQGIGRGCFNKGY